MNHLNKFLARVSVLPMLLLPAAAAAQTPPSGTTAAETGLQKAGENLGKVEGTGATDLPSDLVPFIGKLINGVLGVLGIIFVLLVLYAGYLWMTDMGEADKVKKAKALLGQSVIGLVIIVAAYAISRFVIQLIVTASAGT